MAAYFNLNNNEISKEFFVNKFNIYRATKRVTQKSLLRSEPQRSPGFVQKQSPEVTFRPVTLLKRDSNTGIFL